jgi:hypothetical protein
MPSPCFFDPRTAVRDLLRELAQRGEPRYPSSTWRSALELAESRDTMRQVRLKNDLLWPDPHPVTPLYAPDDDPHRLIFLGYTVQTADRAQEIDEMHEARSNAGDVIYRLKHAQERTAYNREYRQKNREKFLAWQRDYRTANADRLNAARRAKRQAEELRKKRANEQVEYQVPQGRSALTTQ